MAALGIWMWSSPSRFETIQAKRLHQNPDLIPLPCTRTTLFGSSIPLISVALNRVSLVFYSIFLTPCLNLFIPAAFFFLLFMRSGSLSAKAISINIASVDEGKGSALSSPATSENEGDGSALSSAATNEDEGEGSSTSSSPASSWIIVDAPFTARRPTIGQWIRSAMAVARALWPILTGLLFLLAINIVFIFDIETTIRRAIPYQDANDESQWTFGQTLALLLLVLPIRDVFDYIRESRKAEYAQRCTAALKEAVQLQDLDSLREAALHADDVNAYVNGEHRHQKSK
jgi:hypothetical protein